MNILHSLLRIINGQSRLPLRLSVCHTIRQPQGIMLSSVQDIRALRISRYKPHLHLLADELHRGIITRIGQMDRCILVDIPDYPVMECLFQPFLRNRLSDPFIAGQIALQRSLTGAGMIGRVMSADIVRQKAVKFIKALDLGNIKAVKSPLL